MGREILWVGVCLDPTQPHKNIGNQHRHHGIINKICTNWEHFENIPVSKETFASGARCNEYQLRQENAVVIDLLDEFGFHIGFGVKVNNISEGHRKFPKVKKWLRSLDITLPVSVWAWNSSDVPSFMIRRK